MNIQLEKYHGLGNDYIIYDPVLNDMELNRERIRRICDRNFGVGSDGILYGPEFVGGVPSVRVYNPDGSEAEKSGNGIRIFANYLRDAGYIASESFSLGTRGGTAEIEYLNGAGSVMRVHMGRASFSAAEVPVAGEVRRVIDEPMNFCGETVRVTCLTVGNPHCVVICEKATRAEAERLGAMIESAPQFPERVNVQLLQVLDRQNLKIEIYERGAGYTLASGSAACAAARAAQELGLCDSDVIVHMPGGILQIEIRPDGAIYMTGSARHICRISLTPEFKRELEQLKNIEED